MKENKKSKCKKIIKQGMHDIASGPTITHYPTRLPTNKSSFEAFDHWWIGKKWYGICAKCHCVVRINKPIFGGMYFCR